VVESTSRGRSPILWQPHSRLSAQGVCDRRFQHDEPYLRPRDRRLSPDGYLAHLMREVCWRFGNAAIGDLCSAASKRLSWSREIARPCATVDAIRPAVPRYAISNTNSGARGGERWTPFPTLLRASTAVFVSHEIGHRKPDCRGLPARAGRRSAWPRPRR
jgi:hypothetical protein